MISETAKSPWEYIIKIKFKYLGPMLREIDEFPNISQNMLRKQLKISSLIIYHGIRQLKIMRLIINGYGYSLTPLGKEWLDYYIKNGRISKEILKQACLNIDLFREAYNLKIKEEKEARDFFKRRMREIGFHLKDSDIGSAVRRYLEGIFDIKIPIGFRKGQSVKKKKFFNVKKKKFFDDEFVLGLFKEHFKLNSSEIYDIFEKLPKEKREKIFSNLLKNKE